MEDNLLKIKYDSTFHSFGKEINDCGSHWRRKIVGLLEEYGLEYTDPIYSNKERSILLAPAKVECEDGIFECEICIRKITFNDGTCGFFNAFII